MRLTPECDAGPDGADDDHRGDGDQKTDDDLVEVNVKSGNTKY